MFEHVLLVKDIDRDEPIKFLQYISPKDSDTLNKSICEALWILTLNWKSDKIGNETKEIFQKMVQKFNEIKLTTVQMVQTLVEEDVLLECNILNKDTFINNKRRIRTKILYELKKFNLMREENEGYSRLVSELAQTGIDESNVDIVIDNVNSLIGFFKLDPNRVMDVIID